MNEKELILALIQDDLLSQKLINNFRDMGIDAENYQLNLSCTIFKRMNIKCEFGDKDFDNYMLLVEKASSIPIDKPDEFRRFSEELYQFLETLPKQNRQL